MRSLTLIYLVYNEEATLADVCQEAQVWCTANLEQWEIVLVDDGSRDQSPAIAARLAKSHEQIRVATHERNRGMGAAMATGVAQAKMDYFVFLSADGQAPASAIGVMMPLLSSADIVTTIYANARGSFARDALSNGLRLFMRLTAGIRFRLEGLYLFPTGVAQSIAPVIEADTFFFSFELIDRGIERGLRLVETEMEYRQREAGQSKVANLRRVLRVGREVASYAARKRRR